MTPPFTPVAGGPLPPCWAVLHHPRNFARRSGMWPLAEALGAVPVFYEIAWQRLQARSWTLGEWLRRWGIRFYGSTWNALIPGWDEWRIRRRLPSQGPGIVHFLWAEFASPRQAWCLRRRGLKLVGTFHCSARRQPEVLGRFRCFHSYDLITVVSRSQIPYLLAAGVAEARIRVLPHGVDGGFYQPAPILARTARPLQLLCVGETERNHEFLAALMRQCSFAGCTLRIFTHPMYHAVYQGIPSVKLEALASDETLRRAYQEADVLLMPLLDCTFNNAIMEAQACGTPVMANRVGGISEYVSAEAGWIMENLDAAQWLAQLEKIAQGRAGLPERRRLARQWAERFDWRVVGPAYVRAYRDLMEEQFAS